MFNLQEKEMSSLPGLASTEGDYSLRNFSRSKGPSFEPHRTLKNFLSSAINILHLRFDKSFKTSDDKITQPSWEKMVVKICLYERDVI